MNLPMRLVRNIHTKRMTAANLMMQRRSYNSLLDEACLKRDRIKPVENILAKQLSKSRQKMKTFSIVHVARKR